MDPIKIVTPTGCIGDRGIHKESFQDVMQREKPDVVATDAGSLDCGPWYLVTGKPHSPLKNIKWDLDLVLSECVPRKTPIVIGSAGGSGAGPHVRFTVDVIREIAKKRGVKFRLAVITSDVDQSYLAKRAETGHIAGIAASSSLLEQRHPRCLDDPGVQGDLLLQELLELFRSRLPRPRRRVPPATHAGRRSRAPDSSPR